MRDDPEAVALRQAHVRWMRQMAEADDEMAQLETIAAVHPTLFLRFLLRVARWLHAGLSEQAEDARRAARATYEDD